MLVVPDAAMKIAAEKYAARAGHGDAVAVGMVTGFHSLDQGEDQGLGRCSTTCRGRRNQGCTDIARRSYNLS